MSRCSCEPPLAAQPTLHGRSGRATQRSTPRLGDGLSRARVSHERSPQRHPPVRADNQPFLTAAFCRVLDLVPAPFGGTAARCNSDSALNGGVGRPEASTGGVIFGLQQSFKFGKVSAEIAFNTPEQPFSVELIGMAEGLDSEGEGYSPDRNGVGIAPLYRVENLIKHSGHDTTASL